MKTRSDGQMPATLTFIAIADIVELSQALADVMSNLVVFWTILETCIGRPVFYACRATTFSHEVWNSKEPVEDGLLSLA